MNTLDFRWIDWRGRKRILDFVIDGEPLSKLLPYDFVSPFGWLPAESQRAAAARLLRRAPPDLDSETGRVSLCVCCECGDLECGSIGVVVERVRAGIAWREIAADVGPFEFDGQAYHQAFTDMARDLGLGRLHRGRPRICS